MIQLRLTDKTVQKQKYFDTVGEAVLRRIKSLQLSIAHLMGDKIVYAGNDFSGFKSTTYALVKNVAGLSVKEVDFERWNYDKAVADYLTGGKKIDHTIFLRVISFLNYLTDQRQNELEKLLLCPPLELTDRYAIIDGLFTITGPDLEIIEIAFDYKRNNAIANAIKRFFRAQDWGVTCSYCNLADIKYIEAEDGSAATTPQLDHFYSEAEFPVLCYSFFNLIPCDVHCNVSNKGKIRFNKEFYLNPFTGGFENALHFKALTDGTTIKKIDLVIDILPVDKRYNQMLGDGGKLDDRSTSGNLNVFHLNSKYNDGDLLDDLAIIIAKINKQIKGRRTLKGFLNRMVRDVTKEAHISWYEFELMTKFNQKNFSKKSRSKIHRDLHDQLYSMDNGWFNKDIRKIIAQSVT